MSEFRTRETRRRRGCGESLKKTFLIGILATGVFKIGEMVNKYISDMELKSLRSAETWGIEFAGIYDGIAKIGQGVNVYERPAFWKDPRPPEGSLITTLESENTVVGAVGSGDLIVVDHPIVFAMEASDFSQDTEVIKIIGPDGKEEEIDLGRSWIMFSTAQTPVPDYIYDGKKEQVFFVSLGEFNIQYFPSAGGVSFQPEGKDFLFRPQ